MAPYSALRTLPYSALRTLEALNCELPNLSKAHPSALAKLLASPLCVKAPSGSSPVADEGVDAPLDEAAMRESFSEIGDLSTDSGDEDLEGKHQGLQRDSSSDSYEAAIDSEAYWFATMDMDGSNAATPGASPQLSLPKNNHDEVCASSVEARGLPVAGCDGDAGVLPKKDKDTRVALQ